MYGVTVIVSKEYPNGTLGPKNVVLYGIPQGGFNVIFTLSIPHKSYIGDEALNWIHLNCTWLGDPPKVAAFGIGKQ